MEQKEKIERKFFYPAEIEQLKRVDIMLGEGSDYEPLADLTDEQIYVIAQYEAFNDFLKDLGIDKGIDPVINFLYKYKHLSPSKNRMGRQEAVTVLKSSPIYSPNIQAEEEIKKAGIIEKIFGGKK
jgi:hypothetical protein